MKKTLLLLFLLLAGASQATHITGSEITYTNIGNNNYIVHLFLYWDCTGGFNPGSNQSITITGCSNSQFMSLPQSSNTPGDGIDVTKTCPGIVSNCSGGTVSGINMIEYADTITLPGACTDWVFSWETCCRGGNIINITGGTSAATSITAHLNNVSSPNNNSAYFSDYQPLYACVNQLSSFNMSAQDNDGNTLHYAIVGATGSGNAALPYNAPYTGLIPIPGAVIDANTGRLDITPTLFGSFVICIKVFEVNASGDTVGIITRDFQIHVVNCSNQGLTANSGILTTPDVTGNASIASPFVLEACAGSFSFVAHLEDPDVGDSITINTNINSNPLLSGATSVTSYPVSGQYNRADFLFNFTIPPTAGGTIYLVLTVHDNYCPFPAERIIIYTIKVTPLANAGPNKTICSGISTTIDAITADASFSWYDLSDNLIPVNSSFSCNPCQTPVINPATTTSYVLHTNNMGACISSDTVTITVAPNYSWTMNPTDSVFNCAGSPTTLNVLPDIGGGFNYNWLPLQGISQNQTNSPTLNIPTPGTTTYTVTMTSAAGCSRQDSITVVTSGIPPFTLHNDTCMNVSASIATGFDFSCSTSSNCTTTAPCTTLGSQLFHIGIGDDNSNSLPSPFLGFWHDGKMQTIILANDMLAMGMSNGRILSMAFTVIQKNSALGYTNFTIKMGCTNLTQLDTAFEAGLTQVYTHPLLQTVLGTNNFIFDNPYIWDGASNLIIETCFDNTAYTAYDYILNTNTAVISTTLMYTDGVIGCDLPSPSSQYTSRPDITFGQTAPNANYIFQWQPTAGVSNPAIANPVITPPSGTTTYTLTITDVSTSCTTTDSITFNVDPTNPQVLSQPLGDTICANQTINVTVGLSGTGYSLHWYKDDVPLVDINTTTGSLSNQLTITNAQSNNEGWYKCEIIGNCSPFQYSDSVFVKVNSCVGIANQKRTEDILLYPNPVSAQLNIRIAGESNGFKELLIYNTLGSVVLKLELSSATEYLVDTRFLQSGIYNIVLTGENKTRSLKFVKE